MTPRASLPMYMLPGTRGDWALLWDHIARAARAYGVPVPRNLEHPQDLSRHWRDPSVLLSQTCSMPYRQGLKDYVTILGAFDFGLPGCPPGFYNSYLIARSGDPRSLSQLLKARVVINNHDSQSGHGSLRQFAANLRQPPETGGHAHSVKAIQRGQADLAAIDAQSWRLLRRQPNATRGLRILCHSTPTLAPPLITAYPRYTQPLRQALAKALITLPSGSRARLGLRGFIPRYAQTYLDPT